ncbi:hypothetical protein JY651_04340 [Pyxidicoccus parkwayensis]|uniref:Uncharacterized protein n=1 Tax=Pyxidicoccus parkwayensis TaxID=2813578 RepID=A0ABX7NZ50_9BACT|nr:hypothetical protein [Pyxidicoccus parkwaysis]QSQ24206.1 hypothetical protein JY651_04340 [Pyxidicoccus parkwaysis]
MRPSRWTQHADIFRADVLQAGPDLVSHPRHAAENLERMHGQLRIPTNAPPENEPSV